MSSGVDDSENWGKINREFPNAQDAPRDAHPLLYAAWICENTLGSPATKSSLQVISDCIVAIAKTKYRGEKWKHPQFTAFVWLDRQCRFAKMAKIPTNHLFFLNGVYNEINEPEKKLPPFVPCRRCNFGWRYQMKEGKSTGRVEPCECRTKWAKEAKQ